MGDSTMKRGTCLYPFPVALFQRGEETLRLSVWVSAKSGYDSAHFDRMARIGRSLSRPAEFTGMEGAITLPAVKSRKRRPVPCPHCGHHLIAA